MSFWNKEIIKSEEVFFGLDMGDNSLKIIQLEKKGKFDAIRSFNSIKIKADCIKEGQIMNEEKLAQVIKEVVKKSGPKKINTKKVICSLPESKIFLRLIDIPAMEKENIAEAIKWELEANIPLSIEKVYYDYQLLDANKNKQQILTVAVSKEIVDKTMEVLEMSGLSVFGLEMESIAVARSIIPEKADSQLTSFVVDIGEDKTSFVITEGNVPVFTSSIPFSSFGITEAITKAFNIGDEEAEKIKINQGIEHSFEKNSVFSSVRPFLENLSVEIGKTVDFYQDMIKDSGKIEKIIITGGGSNLRGLNSYLTTSLSKEVFSGDPWINLNFRKTLPIINKEKSASFATAIGLAMRKNKYGDNC